MTKPKPILHCDYLDTHVTFKTTQNNTFHPFFRVEKQPFSTRHFKTIEELYYDNKHVAQVRRDPHSSEIPKEMVLIKFDNWLLYRYNMFDYCKRFFELNGLNFKGFSRIDFSLDFQEFDNGMKPQAFINQAATGNFLKLGKSRKATTKFSQKNNEIQYEYLRYGSAYSDFSYYMYNKSLEMREKKHKPYIHDSFVQAGFDMTLDVWRIEFSMKANNRSLTDTITGETLSLQDLSLLTHDNLKTCYGTLRERFWDFRRKDKQKKKCRMKKICLFKREFSDFMITEGDANKDATRSTKIFIKKLEETAQELRGQDMTHTWAAIDLKRKLISDYGLNDWAHKKGIS